MTQQELFEHYRYVPKTKNWNKLKMPVNIIDNVDELNEIYYLCQQTEDMKYIKTTKSGAIPQKALTRFHQTYMVNVCKTGFELICLFFEGGFRFIMGFMKKAKDNTINGSTAVREIYKVADKLGLSDELRKYIVSSEDGLKEKDKIESPIIETVKPVYNGREFSNVHHIDANSSYASRICEYDNKLKPIYQYMYDRRKEDDGYYKHVLTNSIGAFQSKYCVDYNKDATQRHRTTPYALSKLARVAINRNNDFIRDMMMKLIRSGRKPLLINTDGIWYQGDIYHDINEGKGLGQWKNDHKNCELYIKSSGAYQYKENGVIHSVVRGETRLDSIKPDRTTWLWKEIEHFDERITYEFDEERGFKKEWQRDLV